jgi:hypothetical protein
MNATGDRWFEFQIVQIDGHKTHVVIPPEKEKRMRDRANAGWQIQGRKSPWFCCGEYIVGMPTGAIGCSTP